MTNTRTTHTYIEFKKNSSKNIEYCPTHTYFATFELARNIQNDQLKHIRSELVTTICEQRRTEIKSIHIQNIFRKGTHKHHKETQDQSKKVK